MAPRRSTKAAKPTITKLNEHAIGRAEWMLLPIAIAIGPENERTPAGMMAECQGHFAVHATFYGADELVLTHLPSGLVVRRHQRAQPLKDLAEAIEPLHDWSSSEYDVAPAVTKAIHAFDKAQLNRAAA